EKLSTPGTPSAGLQRVLPNTIVGMDVFEPLHTIVDIGVFEPSHMHSSAHAGVATATLRSSNTVAYWFMVSSFDRECFLRRDVHWARGAGRSSGSSKKTAVLRVSRSTTSSVVRHKMLGSPMAVATWTVARIWTRALGSPMYAAVRSKDPMRPLATLKRSCLR